MAHQDAQGTPHEGDERRELAQQEGAEVADDAKQQAHHVATTAKQDAGQVVDEAKRHARDLTHDARQQLHQQARNQTDQLGGALDQFGGRLHALAEGRPEEAGAVGDYADRLADQVSDVAGRIDELGFDGIVDEVQSFARRRPGAFLAGALVAGFATSRLARGAKDAADGEDDTTRSAAGSGMAARSVGSASARTSTPVDRGAGAPTEPTRPLPPPAPTGATVPQPPRDPAERADPLSAQRTNP